jgi:hypothetical protein
MMLNNEKVINFLMIRGADTSVMNDFAQTPLYYASKYILKKYGYWGKVV